MLRPRSTTLSITISELKDFELRCRYRKYLRTAGQLNADGKTPVHLSKGAFDDRLLLPHQNDVPRVQSPTEGSDLEADRGFIYLDNGMASVSESDVERNTEDLVGMTPNHDGGLPLDLELERTTEEPINLSTSHQRREAHESPIGTTPDAAVILPPPFSSRPRALTAPESTTLAADVTIPDIDGCGERSSPSRVSSRAEVEELVTQFDDRLAIRTASSCEVSQASWSRQQQSAADVYSPLHNNSSLGDGLDIVIHDDSMVPEHQPQTPRQLSEAQHQSLFSGYWTAPVSSRTRHGLSQWSVINRDWDAQDGTTSETPSRRATPKSPATDEKGP
ncbi:hypothetical protein NLU13_3594 [Sarocladium strictum]|uniref:Uncharacterized protein n=1 Tax=Sarocladium strictum TaxID=5046 RepID=A0AA39GMM4_SARSR|nr:hypothetical protein NLU13_3594 [Sarocladium strictum]